MQLYESGYVSILGKSSSGYVQRLEKGILVVLRARNAAKKYFPLQTQSPNLE